MKKNSSFLLLVLFSVILLTACGKDPNSGLETRGTYSGFLIINSLKSPDALSDDKRAWDVTGEQYCLTSFDLNGDGTPDQYPSSVGMQTKVAIHWTMANTINMNPKGNSYSSNYVTRTNVYGQTVTLLPVTFTLVTEKGKMKDVQPSNGIFPSNGKTYYMTADF